jgi:hypothetical protein
MMILSSGRARSKVALSFARKALRDALARYKLEQLEHKHRRGYERHPVATNEFSVWETEQAWGDE